MEIHMTSEEPQRKKIRIKNWSFDDDDALTDSNITTNIKKTWTSNNFESLSKTNNLIVNHETKILTDQVLANVHRASDLAHEIDSTVDENPSPIGGSSDDEQYDKLGNEADLKRLRLLELKREQGKNLTFKEAAMYVLWKSQRLMTAIEIVDDCLKQGLISTLGKTPHATMSSQLNVDINQNGKDSFFTKFGAGKFSIRLKFVDHITSATITAEDQARGMILLKGSALPYIPFEAEHNWFEVKPSQLINGGMGLYANYKIPDHTVFSEYKGKIKDIDKGGDIELYPYAVSVLMEDGQLKMIDGLDDDGVTVLSYAPRSNDAGPRFANCILAEYKEHPGRVFLESIKDIQPGEEIFVCYGASYWNIKQYPIFPDLEQYGQLPEYSKSCKNNTEFEHMDEFDMMEENFNSAPLDSPKKPSVKSPKKKNKSSSLSHKSSPTHKSSSSHNSSNNIIQNNKSSPLNSKSASYSCTSTPSGLKIVFTRIKH